MSGYVSAPYHTIPLAVLIPAAALTFSNTAPQDVKLGKCCSNTDRPRNITISGARDVISGDQVTLTCKTSSSNPKADITWFDAGDRQLTSSVTSEIAATAVRNTDFVNTQFVRLNRSTDFLQFPTDMLH